MSGMDIRCCLPINSLIAVIGLLVSIGSTSASSSAVESSLFWQDVEVEFGSYDINTSADGANSVYAADIDGDGDMDALSASVYDDTIAWYETSIAEDGSVSFTAHDISTSADGARSVFAADIDGDGDMDVLSASADDDTIAWYEANLAEDGSVSFTTHDISTSADGATSVYAADIDGDSDMDVLSASADDDTIAWYETNVAEDGSVSFTAHDIGTSADGASSVFAADIDDDGDIDVLSASSSDDTIAWYEANIAEDGSVSFVAHDISTSAYYATSVYAADIDSDGDMDVLSASSSDDTIAWYEASIAEDGSVGFTTHDISTSAVVATSVYATDIDSDGDMDVLSASSRDNTIAWYEADIAEDSRVSFAAHDVSTSANGATSVYAADIDGDGNMDVLSASASDDTIAWYQSEPQYQFGVPESGMLVASVQATDADGDDISYAIDETSIDAERLSINASTGELSFVDQTDYHTPLDSDGDNVYELTVTATAGGETIHIGVEIEVQEDDFAPSLFEDSSLDEVVIDTPSATTAVSYRFWSSELGSLTMSGSCGTSSDAEVSEGFNTLTLTATDNSSGLGLGSYTDCALTVTDVVGNSRTLAISSFSVVLADSDADGVPNYYDVAADGTTVGAGYQAGDFVDSDGTALDSDGDGIVDYLEQNPGENDAPVWVDYGLEFGSDAITTGASGATSVYAADIDGDGDTDALSASVYDDTIAWYEATIGEDGSVSFTAHDISTSADGARSVFAADIDGDGDMDVLSASVYDHTIAWYETNLAEDGSVSFTAHDISTSAYGARSVFAADIDGDGDMDVLSASADDDTIAWYETNIASDGSVSFIAHDIGTSANGASSVFAADIDGDGDMDVLSASEFDHTIAWYEANIAEDGSVSFTAHDISTSTDGAYSVYAADINGDGDMDALSASVYDDTIAWYETSIAEDGSVSFTAHDISTSADSAYSVYAADIDGDGDMDVLSASRVDDTIAWYETDIADDGSVSFTARDISTSADGARSVYAADIDSDGNMDVLSASDDTIAWYQSEPQYQFSVFEGRELLASVQAMDADGDDISYAIDETSIDAEQLSINASTGELSFVNQPNYDTPLDSDGDGLYELTVTATAGGETIHIGVEIEVQEDDFAPSLFEDSSLDEVVIDTPSATTAVSYRFWSSELGSLTMSGSCGTSSDAEVSEGFNTLPLTATDNSSDLGLGSYTDCALTVTDLAGNSRTLAISSFSVVLADSDADGVPNYYDVAADGTTVGAGYQAGVFVDNDGNALDSDGDGIVDYLEQNPGENDAPVWVDYGLEFGSDAITTGANGATSVYAADIDGDGDMDVLSASANDDTIAWYETSIAEDGSVSFTAHDISASADTARSVYAADIDGDGDMDVLSASSRYDTIAWYEATIGENGSVNFTAHDISTSADGAYSVYAADIDGDGDMDVLSASADDDTIAWYETSIASDGSVSFTAHDISTSADGAYSVYAADIDGDGDMDVLSASADDDTIAWYEANIAEDGSVSFTAHDITNDAVGAHSAYAADIDGDGDMDVLSASANDDTIAWYEANIADDSSVSFTARNITNDANYAQSIYAADIDGDGDMDVLSASYDNDTIAWYATSIAEDGSVSFVAHDISTSANGARSVYAADIDSDGNMDVLSASYFDDTIAWYQSEPQYQFSVFEGRELLASVQAMDADGDDISYAIDETSIDAEQLSINASTGELSFVNQPNYDTPLDSDGDGLYELTVTATAGSETIRIGVEIETKADDFAPSLFEDSSLDEVVIDTPSATTAVSYRFWSSELGSLTMSGSCGTSSDAEVSEGFNTLPLTATDNSSDLGLGSYTDCALTVTDLAGNSRTLAISSFSVVLADSDADDVPNYYDVAADGTTVGAGYQAGVFVDNDGNALDSDGDGIVDYLEQNPGESDAPVWIDYQFELGLSSDAITTDADGAHSAYSADIDGDGDMDVLSASVYDDTIAWYETSIAEDGSVSFTAHDISTIAHDARSVFAADIDGDGDMDVLSASAGYDTIAWYETNIAEDGSVSFTAHDISTNAFGARSVFAADIDGDGDMDVLSASSRDNTIAWYETSIAEDGSVSFTAHDISTSADGASSVFAADIDDDGDIDVLSASSSDDTIAWYEANIAEDGSVSFVAHDISTSAYYATSVYAADIDSDGDMDVLSASSSDDTIAWYEASIAEDGSVGFTTHDISTSAVVATSVYATDIDSDGDMDVLSASSRDNTIAWYEADIAEDSRVSFAAHDVSTSANGATSVYAADIDGDGNMDVLSASASDDTIAWYQSEPQYQFGVPESGMLVASVQATDADGDDISYAIDVSNVDGVQLSIDAETGELSFVNQPNYDTPLDSDGNNVYEVTVTASSANDIISISVYIEVIADADGDGIPDDYDLNGSLYSEGAYVDVTGTPIDSDGDGVPDYYDLAGVGFVTGTYVDASGTALDTDNDGAVDYTETYPGENDAPAALGDEFALLRDAEDSYRLDVLANDSDADGDDLWIESATSEVGDLTIDGELVLTLSEFYLGDFTLSYTVTDGQASTTAVISVSISASASDVPLIIAPADLELDATGVLTKVELGVATAVNFMGEAVAVSMAEPKVYYSSGNHVVVWQAEDPATGLRVEAEQLLLLHPQLSLAPMQTVAEGGAVSIEVVLSGDAPEYPIEAALSFSGSADANDYVTDDISKVVISEGHSGSVILQTIADEVLEGDETIEVSLTEGNLGEVSTQLITIAEGNVAPEVELQVVQAGERRTLIAADQGTVTVTAEAFDANNDALTLSWVIDEGLMAAQPQGDEFSFEPSALSSGQYRIQVTVSDDAATPASAIAVEYLQLSSELVELGEEDSDGDQQSDQDEGYGDTDHDGIPDYLDAIDDCKLIPESLETQEQYLVEVETGACLHLGETLYGQASGGLLVSEEEIEQSIGMCSEADYTGGLYDFVVTDLSQVGGSYHVVIPQRSPIPNNAVYRNYLDAVGWVEFVEDDRNQVSSAAGDQGYCPSPLDDSWTSGLTAGHWCVNLYLEDGGPNDADGEANGRIVNLGGVAVMMSENHNPDAVDDALSLLRGQSTVINVLANDSDVDGDSLSVGSVEAIYGEVSITADNRVLYQSDSEFVGEDTITYSVLDSHGGRAMAQVIVSMVVNSPPEVVDDALTVTEGIAVSIDVLANDSDADGDSLTIVSAVADSGEVSIEDTAMLHFTPEQGFVGLVIISYQVSDGIDTESGQALVTVVAAQGDDSSSGSLGLGVLLLLFGFAARRRYHRC
ncbi:FG-GAP-like repeat-containing protein [Ferrimonas lipolytica]|uniref:Cadherin-like domain-containing protein n=1 Tax=Ferrimonas lipolytica TaxID=2724191 RepID=A0A6H1UGE1_9GAMM|nr:FG-GAP-like repeat-containing protein [Ferrimonas lipolytica]QIZ76862.1 cadherin-like domain-containing protein [Ferrimonas lipolytica]